MRPRGHVTGAARNYTGRTELNKIPSADAGLFLFLRRSEARASAAPPYPTPLRRACPCWGWPCWPLEQLPGMTQKVQEHQRAMGGGHGGAGPRPGQTRAGRRRGSRPVGGTVGGTGPRAGRPGRRPRLLPDGGLEFLVLRLRLWVLWVKSDGTMGQELGLEPWLVQGPTAHCAPDGVSATGPSPGSRILWGGGAWPQWPRSALGTRGCCGGSVPPGPRGRPRSKGEADRGFCRHVT